MSYFLSYFPSYIPSYIPKVTTHIEESDRRGGRSHTCLHRSELGTWHVSAYVMTGWHSHRWLFAILAVLAPVTRRLASALRGTLAVLAGTTHARRSTATSHVACALCSCVRCRLGWACRLGLGPTLAASLGRAGTSGVQRDNRACTEALNFFEMCVVSRRYTEL